MKRIIKYFLTTSFLAGFASFGSEGLDPLNPDQPVVPAGVSCVVGADSKVESVRLLTEEEQQKTYAENLRKTFPACES